MSSDALDRVYGGHKFSKKEKQEWAVKKSEEEIGQALKDPKIVSKGSMAFRDHVEKERKRLGLDAVHETTMYCKKCFRQNCIC